MENTDTATLFDIEARVAEIVEKYRKEAYAFVEEMMWNAFEEMGKSILECEARSHEDDGELSVHYAREYTYIMCRRAVNGITAKTLHEIVKVVRAGESLADIPAKMKPGFLMDFLKARSLTFEATRAQYPNYLKPWTEEADQKLLELMKSGLSLKKVAERMGRNPGAIEARLMKLEEMED
jgi:hypothetical protein